LLSFPFFRHRGPVLKGERVTLRLPINGDFAEWAALRLESRAFLEPWEPRWAPDELQRSGWRQRLRRYHQDWAQGTALAFLIFENRNGRLIGGITLGNIRHGVSQSAHIGYWMGERYAGQGFMVDAVGLVAQHAFEVLKLHRIEAACIPDNARSIRVLEKAGFQREGLLRSYLKINGIWADHLLFALIAGTGGPGRGRREG
jgi:[ribosomal protein S5]-alanine N-acetyltransferase